MKKDPSIDAAGGEAIAAVLILAAEDQPLKDRLAKAWVSQLSRIEPSRLSPPFKKRLDHMRAVLPEDELLIDAIEALTPQEASSLAERMVHFALDLEMMR